MRHTVLQHFRCLIRQSIACSCANLRPREPCTRSLTLLKCQYQQLSQISWKAADYYLYVLIFVLTTDLFEPVTWRLLDLRDKLIANAMELRKRRRAGEVLSEYVHELSAQHASLQRRMNQIMLVFLSIGFECLSKLIPIFHLFIVALEHLWKPSWTP